MKWHLCNKNTAIAPEIEGFLPELAIDKFQKLMGKTVDHRVNYGTYLIFITSMF